MTSGVILRYFCSSLSRDRLYMEVFMLGVGIEKTM